MVPVPDVITAPGLRVSVHVPDEGNPLSATDPVVAAHVGCVIVPTVGAAGAAGTALITTFAEDEEVQPAALVTLKV